MRTMTVFERLHSGEAIDIRDADYQKEVHGEMGRCRQLCFEINSTPPKDRDQIVALENELLSGQMREGTFFTPPFQVDLANCMKLGKNVFANHGLTNRKHRHERYSRSCCRCRQSRQGREDLRQKRF